LYYLNDKHPKYEYVLYIRHGKAEPFLGKVFVSYYDIKKELEEIAKRHDRFNQVYFIDEDFFENQYSKGEGTYYKILMREVKDWRTFKKIA
jgi:hypothetical protein